MFIYPYKTGSNSVNQLAKALKLKKIKLVDSNFKPTKGKFVINWGNSNIGPLKDAECTIMNHPDMVKRASNKKTFFELVEGIVPIPNFTTNKEEAKKWKEVVIREKLCGHSGEGIILMKGKDLDEYTKDAPLYVEYIPKKHEYRVHVMGDEVILVQRKAISSSYPKDRVNHQIRNHKNGFVFVKNEEDMGVPEAVINAATLAIQTAELDFGAVDVIYNVYRESAYVLEINTAPGLENTTVDTYIDAIRSYALMLGEQEEQSEEVGKKKSPFSDYEIMRRSLDHLLL